MSKILEMYLDVFHVILRLLCLNLLVVTVGYAKILLICLVL